MLTEATLSYLGFGVPAPQPTWGNMLYGANSSIVIKNYWWRWVYASILLGICVISINVVGDGLRDAVDPKSQER
jgi:peptide/nickel transport system permease protein